MVTESKVAMTLNFSFDVNKLFRNEYIIIIILFHIIIIVIIPVFGLVICHSVMHSFIYSFMHSFIRLFIYSFMYSFIYCEPRYSTDVRLKH